MNRATYTALSHALRQAHHDCAGAICAAEFADSPSWAMREEAKRGAYRIQGIRMQLPVPRDPLGFAVMHDNWRIRRSHVLSRVRGRREEALKARRAAMVRAPGESLLDFIDRKCGFVKDAA
jgi:hypothetical protein